MADLGLGIDIGGLASSAASGAYTVVMTVIIIALIAGIIGIIVYIMSFKHVVHIKVMTKKGFFYRKDKAKEITEDGVKFWKLFRMKEIVTIPPPEATHITEKGRYVAEAYYSEETGFIWAADTVTRESFKNRIEEDVTELINGREVKRRVIKNVFQPFTTQERALQAARVTRAAMRKKKSLLDIIAQLAVPAALIILVVCVLIFWEDIAKPVKEIAQVNVKISSENAKISEQNARILAILYPNITSQVPVKQTIGG